MSPTFQELRIDQLVPHPKNVRRDVGIVTDLANSITSKGIQTPLTVTPHPDNQDKFLIIAGHCRHAAAQLANLDILPCLIDPSLDTETKQIEAMLVENTQRTDLTPTEEANGVQLLLAIEGNSVKSVAKAIGRSQNFVRSRVSLTKLPEEAKTAIDGGRMTLEQSTVFNEFEDDPEATAELTKFAGTTDWNPTVNRLRNLRVKSFKKAASEQLIKDLKIKTIGVDKIYTSKYQRDYDREATPAEHVTAGDVAIINYSGELEWYKVQAKAPKKQLTDEEIADKKRLTDIAAGLDQAEALWNEFLEGAIRDAAGYNDNPGDAPVVVVLRETMFSGFGSVYVRAATALGLPSDVPHDDLLAAIGRLKLRQLAYLHGYLHLIPRELRDPNTWDTGFSYKKRDIENFLKHREQVFGYKITPFEQEALDYWAEKNAKYCSECGDRLESDGTCQACAEAATDEDDEEIY